MASRFIKIVGIIFIVLGIVGFFLPLEAIFHLTPMHNIVHLLSGIIGVSVSGSESKSALFAKMFGVIYLLVAILGLFTHEFLGIIFLMADNILHFLIAFASIYVGFASASKSKKAFVDETLSQ
jgi:uncharacterized membrane protein HdeD (DUF308 family)